MTIINTGGGIMKAGGGVGKSGRALGYQFGVNRNWPLSAAQPPVISTIERLWDSADATGKFVKWRNIETARGVYTWTALDALVADAQSRGADIIYTFGVVPAWANGGLTPDVPPTDFTDFYTFVTALVQRYAGRIRYYEAWNEVDLGGTAQFWSGTPAQMATLATQVYAIVHANDPTALALMPSSSGSIGAAWSTGSAQSGGGGLWYDAFLTAGGGVGADLAAIHLYSTHTYGTGQQPNTDPPEQLWWVFQWWRATLAAHGFGALPVMITEGGWGNNPTSSGHTMSANEMQAWGAIWPVMAASGRAERMLWYATDNVAGGWGVIFSGGAFTPGGLAYATACAWLQGATFTSPVARQANANAIANPAGTGSAGGSLPTGWTISDPDVWGGYGMNYQILGYGPNGGVLFRYYGTATSGASQSVVLEPVASNSIAATPNQFWTIGFTARLAAGSLANVSAVTLNGATFKSGNLYSTTPLYLPISLTGSMNISTFGVQLADPNTAYVVPGIQLNYPVGQPVDITIEIMGWIADTGTIWSGDIARPGGYKGRIVWDATGGPTTYTVPVWASYYRDVTGALRSVTGGTVTLTNLPILLENQPR